MFVKNLNKCLGKRWKAAQRNVESGDPWVVLDLPAAMFFVVVVFYFLLINLFWILLTCIKSSLTRSMSSCVTFKMGKQHS
jgi:hypothetical protein